MPRLKSVWLQLDSIAERLTASRSLWVGSDFDGTLAPIADHPDTARLPRRAREALIRLRDLRAGHLAILSGRTVADLRRQVRLNRVFYAGVGGLETWHAERGREVHMRPDQRLEREFLRELLAWCRRTPGAWLEHKRWSVALHYRAVPPRYRDAFAAGVRRRVRAQNGKATVLHGKSVFEVGPDVPANKATALKHWGPETADGALFYFGDDTNDEVAHNWVRRQGGISVSVGQRASRAEFALDSAEQVVWFLEWLAREWQVRTGGA